MHKNSYNLMRYFRNKYLLDMKGCTVLDIGSRMVKTQQRCYRPLFEDYDYIGMDIVLGPNVDIVGYDSLVTYDVVISGQVMEHINHPWDWLKTLTHYFTEYICIVAPNTSTEHSYPIDTYRYFPDGMRDLFDYAGIKELEIFAKRDDTIGIGTK